MKIIEKFLDINDYSRSGRKLKEKLGIILHWTGPLGHSANQVWNYFNNYCSKTKHYSSAHYIVDFTGEILQAIPDNEVAYHCGSSIVDPKSEKLYTDWARDKFPKYVSSPKNNSPNNCTIGIEMCAINENGDFRETTILSTIELVAFLCKKYNIHFDNIGTHNMVVGWKDCPRLWTKKPYLFDAFIEDVKRINNGE